LVLILAFFILITWAAISLFFLVPRSLTIEENTILFFIINIAISNMFIILTLNLKLVNYNTGYRSIVALFAFRNLIIPVCLLIFLNLAFYYSEKSKKIFAFIITLLLLSFIELLTQWTGIKIFSGWSPFYNIFIYILLALISFLLVKLLKKLP
jgi:hypothetical protein